jgi:hypothetical protein
MAEIEIVIRGKHNTGRTTIGVLFRMFLEENGYADVKVEDTQPLPVEHKGSFPDRWERNRERSITIRMETTE